MKTTNCRACGAEIMFLKTVKGKTIPVNPEPVTFAEGEGGKEKFVLLTGEVVNGRTDPGGAYEGYVSHFATCPEADTFRKRRGKKGDRG